MYTNKIGIPNHPLGAAHCLRSEKKVHFDFE